MTRPAPGQKKKSTSSLWKKSLGKRKVLIELEFEPPVDRSCHIFARLWPTRVRSSSIAESTYIHAWRSNAVMKGCCVILNFWKSWGSELMSSERRLFTRSHTIPFQLSYRSCSSTPSGNCAGFNILLKISAMKCCLRRPRAFRASKTSVRS